MCGDLQDTKPFVEPHGTFMLSLPFVLIFVHEHLQTESATTAGKLLGTQHLRAPNMKCSVVALQP